MWILLPAHCHAISSLKMICVGYNSYWFQEHGRLLSQFQHTDIPTLVFITADLFWLLILEGCQSASSIPFGAVEKQTCIWLRKPVFSQDIQYHETRERGREKGRGGGRREERYSTIFNGTIQVTLSFQLGPT